MKLLIQYSILLSKQIILNQGHQAYEGRERSTQSSTWYKAHNVTRVGSQIVQTYVMIWSTSCLERPSIAILFSRENNISIKIGTLHSSSFGKLLYLTLFLISIVDKLWLHILDIIRRLLPYTVLSSFGKVW